MNAIDLIGSRFGRLTVVVAAESKKKQRQWVCRCDCGNEKTVSTALLRGGITKSCGCLKADNGRAKKTHGFRSHPAYIVWAKIVQRCTNPSVERYPQYGGRGITICDEWRHDPESFCKWAIQNGFAVGLQIDRIDNNKGYSPDNCRFVTVKQNCRNRTTTRWIEYKGTRRSAAEWAEQAGISYSTMMRRLNVLGWPVGQAIGMEQRTR